MRHLRKVVAKLKWKASLERIKTGNESNLRLVAIAIEQLRAEGEETWVGKAIVFQQDCLLDMRKDPVQPTNDASPQAHVLFREVGFHLAWPVDSGNDLSDLGTEH